jgi:hypothetical protein
VQVRQRGKKEFDLVQPCGMSRVYEKVVQKIGNVQ